MNTRFMFTVLVYITLIGSPMAGNAQVASTTIPLDLFQFLLQQQSGNQTTVPGLPVTGTTPVATSTAPVIEDVVYQKNAVPVTTPNAAQPVDRNVGLGDDVTISLTSSADPLTPIDLFVLAFDSNGFATKRIFMKTVFNEQMGVTKKYRLTINQDLLNDLETATMMRVGYCLGGCKTKTARLIPGRVLLPKVAPIAIPTQSTTQSGTQPTF